MKFTSNDYAAYFGGYALFFGLPIIGNLIARGSVNVSFIIGSLILYTIGYIIFVPIIKKW